MAPPTCDVDALVELLKEAQVSAFIVGSEDSHMSEYVPACHERRAYVSGFTGSAGTALITTTEHGHMLWTDGRYWTQAVAQLPASFTLMRAGEPTVPDMEDWLATSLPAGSRVGVDARFLSANAAMKLQRRLTQAGVELVALDPRNPVDALWGAARPAEPLGAATTHPLELAGEPVGAKVAAVQAALSSASPPARCVLLPALDEVAWLLNVRGADVDFNPVFLAYAAVDVDSGAHLFVDPRKVDDALRAHLGEGVTLHAYDAFNGFVAEAAARGGLQADLNVLNWSAYRAAGGGVTDAASVVARSKAVKNAAELRGIREAHVRDGAALTSFLAWLERAVAAAARGEREPVTECSASEELERRRARMAGHVAPSFPTIAGYGPNGAVIHYRPEEGSCATIGTDAPFLLDSGAQYRDGTTDITRTLHFGDPTPHERACFTRVLQGHVALAGAVFPEHTLGSRLDALARTALWSCGLDYNHGTGHGVGAFLNVHEGPQGIGFRKRHHEMGFVEGMTTSNEPGYYEEGGFGIRIENICVCVPAETPHRFAGRKFLGFDTVSFAPIQLKMVDASLLTDKEVAWLNDYHAAVRAALSPLLADDPEALEYLERETVALEK